MFSTKSQLILAQLLNFQRFSSVLSTESSHLIEENKSMSVLFSVWLSDIKQRIQSAKKTKNKKNQLTLKLFEPTYNHNAPETFPEPKTVPNINKEELQKIIEDLFFDISLDNWNLESEIEIEGSSHEKITRRIYKRKGE